MGASSFFKRETSLLSIDIIFILSSAFLSPIILLGFQDGFNYLIDKSLSFILIGAIYIIVFSVFDLNNFRRQFGLLQNIFLIFISAGIALIAAYLLSNYSPLKLRRGILLLNCISISSFALFWRLLYYWTSEFSFFKNKALIIGANKSGKTILEEIVKSKRCCLKIVGFIDDNISRLEKKILDVPIMGDSKNLHNIIKTNNITHLILTKNYNNNELVQKLIESTLSGINIIDMPSLYAELTGKIPIIHIDESWYLQYLLERNILYKKRIKRLLDIVFSIAGLILFSPLMLIISALIKIDSKGKVFYKQERLGKNGIPFSLIKFRTMFSDAEKVTGPVWSSSNDSRVTRVGSILRKWGLDELPQLINVLKGDLSLIGPRPEREHFVKKLEKTIPFYHYRLKIKPGITGLAQVKYIYASSLEQSKEKLAYDLYYIKNVSFPIDILILLETIKVTLLGKKR